MIQVQRIWTPEETSYLHRNYGKMTYAAIGDALGRTPYQVRNKASYECLTGNSNLGRKYSANLRYFSTPNVGNCYFAGFIAADGNIRGKQLSIGLQKSDIGVLHAFKEACGYTGDVKEYSDRVSITICCQQYVDDLKQHFNITPRKSKTLQPPNLTNDLLVASFIKGVIDGDGSVDQHRITIYGTLPLLTWIKSYIDNWTPPTNYPLSRVRRIQSHLHSYRIGGNRREVIFSLLKGLPTYHLPRKWNKPNPI